MSDAWLELLSDPCPWSAPQPLPGPVETPRTRVRVYERGDGPALFAAIDADRDALLPWMAWAKTDHQQEIDSVYYVESCRRSTAKPDCTDFPMGIFDRATGALLGGTGIHRIRPHYREGEIGYWLRGSAQGQGYCSEAIGALISSALTPQERGGWGFRRIVVFAGATNSGSRRVCQKLGLRLESRTREERYLGLGGQNTAAGYHDTLGFAVLDREWDFAQHRARPNIAWADEIPD